MAPLRIAIDTGGTFTDCVYRSADGLRILKLPSTPDDPGRAILTAIAQIAQGAPVEIRHGTTVGTNALLERKGARVAFVTTAGFEDVLAIGRQSRPKIYDLFFQKEEPLAPRNLCFGVEERTAPDGEILRAVDNEALEKLTDAVRQQRPESVAVSLLFSFANPRNEVAVAAALQCLGVPVSVSHEILPEFREYERGITVLINAYLAPKMKRYIETLDQALGEVGSSLHVMQSAGGIISAAMAAREPVRTVLSGPAGGIVGALAMARAAGLQRVLTFDMGGTSTDVALVDNQAGAGPRITTESRIMGMPVAVPMLQIHTVGAGGGSLAGFDRGGALKVGPESAGAFPGPICYGHGVEPTVTDANLVLGRLEPDGFLGGGFPLDEARTKHYVEQARNGLPTIESFAEGVVRLAELHMERALRHISIEAGYDPRDFTLVCFGGAGPLHACALAKELKIPRVMVPSMPGALSAYGIFVSDVVRDYSRTVMLPPWDPALDKHLSELETCGLREMHAQGLSGVAIRSLDLRYRGQGFELAVDWSPEFVQAFHVLHRTRYGYCDESREVEVVNVRVRIVARSEPDEGPGAIAPQKHTGGTRDAELAIIRRKPIYCRGEWWSGTVYDRSRLQCGDEAAGPAVIVEYSATTFLPPGCRASVDGMGNLLISVDS